RVISKLQDMALGESNEALHRAIARGLVKELRSTADDDLFVAILPALQEIGAKTSYAGVQEIVVDGIMRSVLDQSHETEQLAEAAHAAEAVAIASKYKAVMELAVSHMLKVIKAWDSWDQQKYSEEIQGMVDRIGAAAGGLAN